MLLLVPADPLRPRRPDDHFAAEARAARGAGFDVALVDHDALARGDDPHRAVRTVPPGGPAVYRGWMLRSERYADLATALAARGVTLRTSAEQYRRAHELPGWYGALTAHTPRTTWTTGTDRADFDRARVELGDGPAVLRDWTKSMKHHWHDAAYLPDLGDADGAWRVATRLRELRDDEFVGGFVLRRFEDFTTVELRTWWVDGVCVLTGPHPDTPHEVPDPPVDTDSIAPAVAGLGLPFVTVDLALRADGVWRIMEVGDGQVSDRPSTMDPADLVAALGTGPR